MPIDGPWPILNQPTKFVAKYFRMSLLRHVIRVELPNGSLCDISGNAFTLGGSFELDDRKFNFNGETLFANDTALADFNYSSGVMGVGESFALVEPDGEFMFALRPQGRFGSNQFSVSSPDSTKAEITRSFFGRRFTANASDEIRPEFVLLCLWVAMVKMSG